MNRKKNLFVFNKIIIVKTRFWKKSISILLAVFELCDLLHAFLVTKLLVAKLCLLVFGATFVEWHWQFVRICSCFNRD